MSKTKICYKCKKEYPLPFHAYFSKDVSRVDGFCQKCKQCIKDYQAGYQRRLKKSKRCKINISLLRERDRAKYKGEFDLCSVLRCGFPAELHHIKYEDESTVIPLCRKHHMEIHAVNNLLSIVDITNDQN